MKDKNYQEMITALGEVSSRFICVQPSVARALDVRELTQIVENLGFTSVRGGSVEDGLRMATKKVPTEKVLVTGSFYVVGEALEFLQKSGKTDQPNFSF
jgi:folylpolyglutamate synthase/dihydropteroate synthase